MSGTRRKSTAPQPAADSKATPNATAKRSPAWSRHATILSAAFVVVCIAYWLLFYSDTTLLRTQSLPLLVAPDVIWEIWTGAEPEHVRFFDRVPVFLVAACVLATGYCLGYLLLIPLRLVQWSPPAERFVFRIGAGLSLLSILTLAIGLLGGLQQSWLFTTIACTAAAAALMHALNARRRQATSPHANSLAPPNAAAHERPAGEQGSLRDRFVVSMIFLLAVPCAVYYLWTASQPPWEFDVREYHLQMPKEWYQAGRIGYVDHNVYGNMPLGAEMHVLLSMIWMGGQWDWWYGALAGKVVIASFSILAALALFTAGRRFLTTEAGVVAAVLYLCVPWLFHVSTVGLVEGVFAFYFWMAIYCLWCWYRHCGPAMNVRASTSEEQPGDKGVSRLRHLLDQYGPLLLAGWFAGSAAACKYTAVVFVLIPLGGAVLLLRQARQGQRSGEGQARSESQDAIPQARFWADRLSAATLFTAAALFACGLWYGKNLVLTGNPVFPLAWSVFGGKGWDASTNEQWTAAHAVPRDAQGRRYTVRSAWGMAKRLFWRSEWLSPILVPFFLWGLIAVAVRSFGLAREVRSLAAFLIVMFAVVVALWWLLTHRYDRFLIPALPMVAFVGALGTTCCQARAWRYAYRTMFVIGSLLGLVILLGAFTGGDRRILHALEHQRQEQPVEEGDDAFFIRTHIAHQFLNRVVPPGHRVLLVGEAQVFDLQPPVLYNTCFDDCWLEVMMKGRSAEQRREILKQYRVSHVFVHWHEIRRYRSPGNYGYTDYVQPEVFEELVEQGILRPLRVAVEGLVLESQSGQVFEVVGHENWEVPSARVI